MSEKALIEKDLSDLAQKQQEEQLRNLERYHYLKDNGYILFETITGSQAHGTNTELSDIDKAFVYILPENDILGLQYKEQLKIHKDFMGYEIRRFLELLREGNPTNLELLNSPEDCILIKHPAFDLLLNQKEKFITKVCENAFYGYARQQRKKAEGLEKLQNWEVNRVTKKTPLDFCYVVEGYDAIPVKKWLDNRGLDQLFCALTAVNHCRDLFAVFYDYEAHAVFSERIPLDERESYKAKKKSEDEKMGLGYKGIAFEDSNDIRLSNIPIEERKKSICHLSYNKDGYKKHCDDYKKYQEWLKNRNMNRWVEIQGHGQQIDGKNMMHFMRLVHIGREIAQGKGIQIRRPDAQELLKIRKGEVSLKDMFEESDAILNEMKVLFQNSNLPEEVSQNFIHELLVSLRKSFYSDKKSRNGAEKIFKFHGLDYGLMYLNFENSFMVNKFGKKSELHFKISLMIDEYIGNAYNGDLFSYAKKWKYPWINIIEHHRIPKTKNLENGKLETLSLEKISILSVSRDKITIMAGADYQEALQFDIVMWEDTAVPINIIPVSKWIKGMSQIEFLQILRYKITNEDINE